MYFIESTNLSSATFLNMTFDKKIAIRRFYVLIRLQPVNRSRKTQSEDVLPRSIFLGHETSVTEIMRHHDWRIQWRKVECSDGAAICLSKLIIELNHWIPREPYKFLQNIIIQLFVRNFFKYQNLQKFYDCEDLYYFSLDLFATN